MASKLLVFDSLPSPYRAPIWQTIEKTIPSSLRVVYASDKWGNTSNDVEFGQKVKWGEPLLSGYENTVLDCKNDTPPFILTKALSLWNSISGNGVAEEINKNKPDYILLTGLIYKYDYIAYREARKRKIPLWLRCETQDNATERSFFKATIRSLIYRTIYRGISRFFYIGELNKQHYLKHGVSESKLSPALYGTVNRYKGMDLTDKENVRKKVRNDNGISMSDIVIGFSGKFIEKKNPIILYKMLDLLPPEIQKRIVLYFVGSGPLENELIENSKKAFSKYGIRSVFTGFVEQTKIGDHYLAMDILVLPSRKMGETWGLVVNEAFQAGCCVIASNAVGCSKDFFNWERFEVISVDAVTELAEKVLKLAGFRRDFNWALELLIPYSIESTANSFIEKLNQ